MSLKHRNFGQDFFLYTNQPMWSSQLTDSISLVKTTWSSLRLFVKLFVSYVINVYKHSFFENYVDIMLAVTCQTPDFNFYVLLC